LSILQRGDVMNLKLLAFVYFVGLVMLSSSCNRKNDYATTNAEVIREWNFPLSSNNENTVTTGAEITAQFHMVAMGDSSITYDVKIDSASDRIATAQINLGDPVSEGPLLMNLPVRVYSTYASGVVTGLRPGFIDTLLNNNIEKYINITSGRAPAGIVRGQLNSTLVLSRNVPLTGTAVVPSATTTASGTAFLRLASNNTLYSKVVVNNDPADPVTAATINQGVSGSNGPSIVNLASSASEFGTARKTAVNASAYSTMLSNNTYVNVSSAGNPNGKLRGQIR
jgi:hypothetical protein